MVCRVTCMISLMFIVGSLYMVNAISNSEIVKKYKKTLPQDLRIKYEEIVDERTKIYYQGFGLGLILSLFAIIYNYKIKKEEKFDIISITCMTIAISFVTNFFYYMLHPKKNYMLQYLQTKEQNDNWLVVYKEMQKYYYTGLFLGIIGVGVISVAFRC